MLAFGTKVGLDELAVTVKVFSGVSGSVIVKTMAALGVFSGIVWLPICESVGGTLIPGRPRR